jgi:hypothetical protein
MPITSKRSPVAPIAARASGTLLSTGLAGPPRLMIIAPMRCAVSLPRLRAIATVMRRPRGLA